jgi:hypothetical protein
MTMRTPGKLSGARHLLICVALATLFVIEIESQLPCDPHCISGCVKFNQTAGLCDRLCNLTWGINFTSHTCGRCDPQCLSACNTYQSGTCDNNCQPGYCINSTTHKCTHVPHCINCSTSDVLPCTACESGYTLNNGQCLSCDPHCNVSCTFPYTCPQHGCKAGYTSDEVPNQGLNYTCGKCGDHCIGQCDQYGSGRCDSPCELGWAVNSQTHQCAECGRNCPGGCAISGPDSCDCWITPCDTGYVCDPIKKACYP